jgi:hypothetical protein
MLRPVNILRIVLFKSIVIYKTFGASTRPHTQAYGLCKNDYMELLIKVLSRFMCFFTAMGVIYIHVSPWHDLTWFTKA